MFGELEPYVELPAEQAKLYKRKFETRLLRHYNSEAELKSYLLQWEKFKGSFNSFLEIAKN